MDDLIVEKTHYPVNRPIQDGTNNWPKLFRVRMNINGSTDRSLDPVLSVVIFKIRHGCVRKSKIGKEKTGLKCRGSNMQKNRALPS